MLPLLNLKLGDSTGVPIVGVERSGVESLRNPSDRTNVQHLLTDVPDAKQLPTSGATRIRSFISAMTPSSPPSVSERLERPARDWVNSYTIVMAHKKDKYAEEKTKANTKMEEAKKLVNQYVQEARKTPDPIADSKTPTWDVAKDESGQWSAYVKQYNAMNKLYDKAHNQYSLITDPSRSSRKWLTLMKTLAESLERLVNLYETALPLLMDSVADLVYAFCNEPLVTNAAYLNWVLLGNPGVGKTLLAKTIGDVLGALGVILYKDPVECGRSHFVAEYEGQTALKARTFLVSNLEKVIFLDEAYSLTSWETKVGAERRQLSAYSGEAVTEIVAFLSQHVGQVSFIAAGYEREMLRDFMPSNPGLDRRFPYKIWIEDYDPLELVDIYLAKLGEALTKDPRNELTKDDTRPYFTEMALRFLGDIISESRITKAPKMEKLFKAQGGAMANLANTTALLISGSTHATSRTREIGFNNGGEAWAVTFLDMYNVLSTVAQNEFGPKAHMAITEMQKLATVRGWINEETNQWQFPSNSASKRARSSPSVVSVDDDEAEVPYNSDASDASEEFPISAAARSRPRSASSR